MFFRLAYLIDSAVIQYVLTFSFLLISYTLRFSVHIYPTSRLRAWNAMQRIPLEMLAFVVREVADLGLCRSVMLTTGFDKV